MSGSTNSPISPRSALGRLPAYAAGKVPVVVEGLESFKLSSNEVALPPLPEVLEAVAHSVNINRYPDTTSGRLRHALSEFLSVPADDIVAGGGSLGALIQILSAFAGANDGAEPDEVIYAWRSFEAYPIVVGLAGAKSVQVPLTAGGRHDLPAMVSAITDRTTVILLCTPNNPTGPVLHTDEVRTFLAQVPSHVVVVLDEAYVEFVTDQAAVRGLDIFKDFPNVVLLRTFSKAYGLAGLRVGYSVSHPELTRYLRQSAVPFAVSSIAEAAAVESLRRQGAIMERVGSVISEREFVVAGLRELGWPVPQAQGNFVWLNFREQTADFAALMEANGLAVRAFGNDGVRMSIGEPEANRRFLTLCEGYKHVPLDA